VPAKHVHAAAPAFEMLLVGHAKHALLPVTALYVLAAQLVHAAPLGPVKPAGHRHADSAVAPVLSVTALAGHAVHELLPAAVLYEPIGQRVHWPLTHCEPAGHDAHAWQLPLLVVPSLL
jgi:hypothetical protein